MEISYINQIKKATTFSEINAILEGLIESNQAYNSPSLFVIGYSSLINYPAIILTKDLANKEVKAACDCYKLMMQYSKGYIDQMVNSDDEKTRLAAQILIIPPLKRLLLQCNSFYMLNYLIQAEYSMNHIEYSAWAGDDFAKQWLFILKRGYKDDFNDKAIDYDVKHLKESHMLISKMKLNEDNMENLKLENINFKSYYQNSSSTESVTNNGCLSSFIIFITIALSATLLNI